MQTKNSFSKKKTSTEIKIVGKTFSTRLKEVKEKNQKKKVFCNVQGKREKKTLQEIRKKKFRES